MTRTTITDKQLTLLKQAPEVNVSQDEEGNSLVYRPCSALAMLLDSTGRIIEVDDEGSFGDEFDPDSRWQQDIIQFIMAPISTETLLG